jgi:hypothetical protein
MSSTRINQSGTFCQERWASSPALDRALKANLVAARCATLQAAEQREAVWFLQYLSMHAGGLLWAASEIAPDGLHGADGEKWVARLALDPAANSDLENSLPALKRLMADYTRQKSEGAVTEIGRLVCDTLDFCSESKGLVLISGQARRGKTWAARRWVEQHPGQARFCETPSSQDDLSFFIALANALGITTESNAKRKNLAPRIEAALEGGDLVLVLDEAANLWPACNRHPTTRPARIAWIMEIINRGAVVALLATGNFFAAESDYLEKSRWQSAQLYGRISRYTPLPESLSISDLEAVARAWLPHGTQRAIEALADVAALSQRYLAAIEHAVKQVTYFSRQDGRERPEWEHIARAIKSGVLPGETALTAALAGAAGHRKPLASGSRR